MSASDRRDLIPPQAAIDVARWTMGGIDLDPYSTSDVNRVVEAGRFHERSTMEIDQLDGWHWQPPDNGRLFLGVPSGLKVGRALASKAIESYRAGGVSQAVLWLGCNETLAACPWVWDFPICIPFRRLAPRWWDDELEKAIRVPPADWSAIIYLPPAAPAEAFSRSLGRFHAAAGPVGRVVLDQWSGENHWLASYDAAFGRNREAQP